nr:metallopeptidase family protein [Streptomyces sp. or43]
MLEMTREAFEELVGEALDRIPPELTRLMDNVAVFVEDEPESDDPELLGLYEGTPLTERGEWYAGVLPDRIGLRRARRLRALRGAGARVGRSRRFRLLGDPGARRRGRLRRRAALLRGARPTGLRAGAARGRDGGPRGVIGTSRRTGNGMVAAGRPHSARPGAWSWAGSGRVGPEAERAGVRSGPSRGRARHDMGHTARCE